MYDPSATAPSAVQAGELSDRFAGDGLCAGAVFPVIDLPSAAAVEGHLLFLCSSAASSAAAASTAAIESAIRIESAVACSALAALLPQDAKDTATIATAIKTNFFIFFTFKT